MTETRARRVNPGSLDRRVTIKSRVTTQDSRGDLGSQALSTVATVWAKRTDIAGKERFASGRVLSQRVGTYLVRHRDDITEQMVLVDGSETFEIVGLAEIGRRSWLELSVEAPGA